MKKLKKILVVIEPKQMRQVALERAMALAQASGRSSREIIAVLPVTEFSWDLTAMLSVEQKEQMKKAAIDKNQKWLNAYLAIHAMGFDIKTRILCSKNVGKDITALVHDERIDLIIKAHEVHGMLDSMLFTPLDWQLLRHAPVPVIIAKDHIWHPTGTIAVALDLSDPNDVETRLLNVRLLREAQELSRIMHCQIHLLNAIPPLLPPASIDLPGFTPDLLGDAALKEGCKAVLSFAARHNIPADYCHIREGQPDDVIPSLCAELKPTALFIGTSARKGVAVALVGNICERVVEELECDVAVITPKAVISRVPFTAEGAPVEGEQKAEPSAEATPAQGEQATTEAPKAEDLAQKEDEQKRI